MKAEDQRELNLGERINMILRLENINQAELSSMININDSHISQVINNHATFSDSTLRLICQLFKINENWLFYGIGEMYINQETYNKQVERIMNFFSLLTPEFQQLAFKYFKALLEAQYKIIQSNRKVIDKKLSKK